MSLVAKSILYKCVGMLCSSLCMQFHWHNLSGLLLVAMKPKTLKKKKN